MRKLLAAATIFLMASGSTARAEATQPADPSEIGQAIRVILEEHADKVAAADLIMAAVRGLSTGARAHELRLPPQVTMSDPGDVLFLYEALAAQTDDEAIRRNLVRRSVETMLASVDDESEYMTMPAPKLPVSVGPAGPGLSVSLKRGTPQISAITRESPAWQAGLKTGDRLLEVDGLRVDELSFAEGAAKLRGGAGTMVTLLVATRGTDAPRRIELQRVVDPPNISTRVIGRLGYVRVNALLNRADEGLRDAIISLDSQLPRADGFIIDVRGNPGGLLNTAYELSDLFLGEGMIGSMRGRRKGDIAPRFARKGDMVGGRPIVVLVDDETQAGAEIFALSLQANGRARVVGRPTAGKGLISISIPLSSQHVLRIPTARFHGPSGTSLDGAGVTPDLVVHDAVGAPRVEESRVSNAEPETLDQADLELMAAVRLLAPRS